MRFRITLMVTVLWLATFASLGAQETVYAFLGTSTALGEDAALDFIVNRYNETRPTLSNPLDPLDRYYLGASAGLGLNTRDTFIFDIIVSAIPGYLSRSVDGSNTVDMVSYLGQATANFAYSFLGSEELRLGAGLGLGASLVGVASSANRRALASIFSQGTGSLFAFGQVIFRPFGHSFEFMLRPGVVVPLTIDYRTFNRAINPSSWSADTPASNMSNFIHFRLDVGLLMEGVR